MLRKQVVASFAAGLMAAYFCAGQSAAPEKFEVASVRINPAGKVSCGDEPRGCARPGAYGGAIYTATNVPLMLLVELAFGVEQDQISGGDKLATDRYDISAKPASGTLSHERLKPMLRSLLEERFGLQTHRENKEVAGYALVLAKTGPKLTADSGVARPFITYPGGLEGAPGTLDTLAAMLASPVGKPVVNKTGLEGNYDLKLRYAPEGDTNTSLPSLFTAIQEQLGLRLESQKVPLEMLVIDRCERVPTEN